jgi:hypothetical protein
MRRAPVRQVELWTQPQHRVHTGVKRNRRNPNWKGQALEVLVQEPESQVLRVVVQDIDMLNVTVCACARACVCVCACVFWGGGEDAGARGRGGVCVLCTCALQAHATPAT